MLNLLNGLAEVVIEVTPRCNLKCPQCFNRISFAKAGRRDADLSPDIIFRVLDAAAAGGVRRIRFSGGEPLLRGDIHELIEEARRRNFSVWLNTNGTLLTRGAVKKLERHVENILVPLNGPDEIADSHWTCVTGSFESKARGLSLLQNSSIPVVRVGTVLTPSNLRRLDEFSDQVRRLHIAAWEFYRPILRVKQPPDTSAPEAFRKLCDAIPKMRELLQRPVFVANSIPFCCFGEIERMDEICVGPMFDEGYSRLVVDPEGTARPGYFLREDLGPANRLLDCWNHPFQRKMRDLEFLPEGCRSCPVRRKCRGGSRYMAKLFFGDYSAPDPLMLQPTLGTIPLELSGHS